MRAGGAGRGHSAASGRRMERSGKRRREEEAGAAGQSGDVDLRRGIGRGRVYASANGGIRNRICASASRVAAAKRGQGQGPGTRGQPQRRRWWCPRTRSFSATCTPWTPPACLAILVLCVLFLLVGVYTVYTNTHRSVWAYGRYGCLLVAFRRLVDDFESFN